MKNPAELSFRDFAGAIMQNNLDEGAEILAVLLGLDAAAAKAATAFFQRGMTSGPDFMMKAMSMRTAVTSGDEAELLQLMTDCFDLHGDAAREAVAAVRARYPAPGAAS